MILRIWKKHFPLWGAIAGCITLLAIVGCDTMLITEQQQSSYPITAPLNSMQQEIPPLSVEPSPEPNLKPSLPMVTQLSISTGAECTLPPILPSDATASSQTKPVPKLVKAMTASKDVIGWITIPDTIIEYPVVQGEDNKFYLDHDLYQRKSISGSIFMDYRADGEKLTGNIILYGHHMKNGSMFTALMGYKERTFFQEHPIIEYYTPCGRTRWQIFSAYVTDTKFYYIETNFANETFRDFLSTINKKSKFQTGIPLNEIDAILTLSTCTYEFDDARFVVHARRLIN